MVGSVNLGESNELSESGGLDRSDGLVKKGRSVETNRLVGLDELQKSSCGSNRWMGKTTSLVSGLFLVL